MPTGIRVAIGVLIAIVLMTILVSGYCFAQIDEPEDRPMSHLTALPNADG